MRSLITGLSIALSSFLISGCIDQKSDPVNPEQGNDSLINRITNEVESRYDPVPKKYLDLPEYIEVRENYHMGDFTNAVVHDVLGHDVEIVEHRFDESLVYAVSFRCTLPNDPIPELSHDDVEKIIYGYSIDDGLVIEDSKDIESIITSIKTQSVEEYEITMFLPVGDLEEATCVSTTWVHGCTLGIRMILSNGEETGTHGHVEDRDWNPVVADLFIKAMDEGRVTYLGRASGSMLYPEEQEYELLKYRIIDGGSIAITDCESNAVSTVVIPAIIKNRPVTCVEGYAFRDCSRIEEIIVSSTVTNIEGRAFDCPNLTAITVEANNPAYSSSDGVLLNKNQTDLICVPNGKSGSYTIPDSVTRVQKSAFSWDSSLTNITIPNSVTNIEELTVFDFPNLMHVSVDNKNPTYSSVDGVLLDKCKKKIIGCPRGKGGCFTIPNGVASIGDFAFFGCHNLTRITVPNSVTTIGYLAFFECTHLTEMYFSGKAPSLYKDDVFDRSDNLMIYYTPGTTGWKDTFGGRPTALKEGRGQAAVTSP